jgi:hypothetical protein
VLALKTGRFLASPLTYSKQVAMKCNQIEEQVAGVPRAAQVGLGRAAAETYRELARTPNAFDLRVLHVFSGLEECASDIDERIEQLRTQWKSEGFFRKWRDRTKLQYVLNVYSSQLFWERKQPGMAQLHHNWNRLRLISDLGVDNFTVAKAWVNPVPEPSSPAIESL